MTLAAASRNGGHHRLLLALILLSALALRVIYALPAPHIERFEDEKYALANVVGLVVNGSFQPVRTYYPSPVFFAPPAALVAASNAIYRATGDSRFLAVDEQGVSHAAAFWICRLLMALYGTLALWAVFLVGRQLFTPRVGLLAAAILAFVPWLVHSSGTFKPDPLLLLCVVLAFHSSLRAMSERRLGPYLVAGVAIALAASSKMTGLLIAVPLTVATAMSWRDLRRWALLATAGVASLVTFVLLNPYWWAYPRFIAGLRLDYAKRADWASMTRQEIPGRVLELLFGETGHGAIVGGLALLGLLALTVRACRHSTASAERRGLVMLLVFPPVYVAAYTLQTAHFKSNNFLPVLPFTALAAAWLLAGLWRRIGRLWPVVAGRIGSGVAVAGVALLLAAPGVAYVYESLVPSTEDLARIKLRKRLGRGSGRSVVLEPVARQGSAWEGAARLRVLE